MPSNASTNPVHPGAAAEAGWFALNPDKAFGEKLFLGSVPCFLDEKSEAPPWPLSRVVIEASFAGITSMTLLDLWANFIGPIAS